MDLLDALPRPSPNRLAVRTTADARRRIRAGHPWVFEGSIRSVNHEGAAGDIAVVFDDDRRFVAVGLWDPASPIRLKVLHQGAPTTIDRAWFAGTFAKALAARRPLIDTFGTQAATTAYRVVNGENDGLPGLVLDRYDRTLVLKLYSPAWLAHLATIVPVIGELLRPRSIVLRMARSIGEHDRHGLDEGDVLLGEPVDERVSFLEHGLRFEADVVHGQKTGHFLDQRDNRALVGTLASGRRVLDLFSCTGGFSVHAAAGGATVVHSVDSSPQAIALAQHNMTLNADRAAVTACRHDVTVGEAYTVMEQFVAARKRFGVVVIDPPSFARNAASVDRAIIAYRRLATLGISLVERGGVLVQSSCSSRVSTADFMRNVHGAAAEIGYDLEEIARTGHAIDHPVGFPEGEYLKTLISQPVRH